MNRVPRVWILFVSMAMVISFMSFSCSGGPGKEGAISSVDDSQRTEQREPFTSTEDVVEAALPAVVSILTGEVDLSQYLDPFAQRTGGGSGVIFNPDGLIVTNSHVIANESYILVSLSDGRSLPAEIVGHDPESDLAVIKIEARELPVLPFGDTNQLRMGEAVLAIGNALALEGGPSVTSGVVSALNRSITLDDGFLTDLVQTDAAINLGNSGGPLLNMRAEVVGINTALDRRAPGIGFAIGTDTIRRVLDQLVTQGKVTRGYLGVNLATVNSALATRLNLGTNEGVLITAVFRGSPADIVGLRQKDVVIKFNGETVTTDERFIHLIRTSPVGEGLDLTYIRDGEEFTITVTLAERQ